MAREFSLCIHKNSTLIYELFLHGDGKMLEQEVYPAANIDEGIEVVEMLSRASAYYRRILADVYEVVRLAATESPLEFDIEMMRGGVLFRAYKWHEDNTFDATVLESNIDLEDFQENNRLNKLVCILMRNRGFSKFELTNVLGTGTGTD